MSKINFAKSVPIAQVYKMYTPNKVNMTDGKVICPFHDDHHPSMSLKNNYFHCFACGCKGSTIDFVLRARYGNNSLKFMDAVNDLCEKFGYVSDEDDNIKINHPDLYAAKKKYSKDLLNIAKVFNYQLQQLKVNYFSNRGIPDNIQKEYNLGYIPMTTKYKTDGDISSYITSGLCQEDGTAHLKGRYIIPLKDQWGNVIAFLGRSENDVPKYLTTKGNKYYGRNNVLFNYDKAKHFEQLFVVEGALDALSLRSQGIENVVALLGCVLSEEQEKLLANKKIILALDNDDAGRNATRTLIKEHPGLRMSVYDWADNPYKDFNEWLMKSPKTFMKPQKVVLSNMEEQSVIQKVLASPEKYSKREIKQIFKKELKNILRGVK